MTPLYRVILSAVVIILMLTAGCTTTTGPSPLVTSQVTTAASPAQTSGAPAATNQPGTAGTTGAPGVCSANIQSDAANCGGCGYACPANALCQSGQCFCREGFVAENNACVVALAATNTDNGCPAGMSPCPDGYCYELASSATNCGICGNVCPAGMTCSASTCSTVPTETTTAVPTTTVTTTTSVTTSSSGYGPTLVGPVTKSCLLFGQTNCGGTCVNLTTNTGNCGSCGHICSGLTATCCGGGCTNLKTDNANCGTCGHVCKGLSSCNSGSCSVKTVVTGISLVTAVPKITVTVPKYQVNPVIVIPGY